MMEQVHPKAVLEQVAAAVPPECHPNIIVIGSLAVAHQLLGGEEVIPVRTKDIDCVLSPRIVAVDTAQMLAQALLDAGWHPRKVGRFRDPGGPETPDDQLPAVRLYPPDSTEWFVELLTVPSGKVEGKEWKRLILGRNHYALPSFEFLSIATHEPVKTEVGISCARPEMMALANLLKHPTIKPELISDTDIKRSNKDLGRVLAVAFLSEGLAENAMTTWPPIWERALRTQFRVRWKELAGRAGRGMRQLLSHPEDLEQATEICNTGILAHRPVTSEQLGLTGRRLLQDAIQPLEHRG